MKRIAAAILCAAACVATARAGIVHFVNPAQGQPGHYDWRYAGPYEGRFLNITQGPAAQTGVAGVNSVAQVRIDYDFGDIIDDIGEVIGHFGYGEPLADVLVVPSLFTAALMIGQQVDAGGGLMWSDRSRHMAIGLPGLSSEFPVSERRYIGVRISGGRFGWIEVERDFLGLTAHSWAYQTEPGVPITAGPPPAPGAAVLLGLGIATSRRRRS